MSDLNRLRKAIEAHLSYVILDTETTGLYNAEIVQIAIIEHQANVLLDTYVQPQNAIPEEATAIHGITDEMVVEAPQWYGVCADVRRILDGKLVLIYNADFDMGCIRSSDKHCGLDPYPYRQYSDVQCVMKAYAEKRGDWHNYYKSYSWQTLTSATQHFGYELADAHTALADCLGTLAVVNGLMRT